MPALYTPFYCEENVYQLASFLSSSDGAQPRFTRLYAVFISNLSRRALLFQQKASRAGAEQGCYVIWDYHVVAVGVLDAAIGEKERVVVLDRDSRLGDELDLTDYVLHTFRPDLFAEDILDPSLQSRLRVVPAADFLVNFASDRSHMLLPPSTALDAAPLGPHPSHNPSSTASILFTASPRPPPPPEPRYIQPPPPYPPIQGSSAKRKGETHNLWTKWLDVGLPGEEQEEDQGEKRDEPEQEEGFGVVLKDSEALLRYAW
ncbi:hypothetical protein JCM11251_006558 [Rhodosporidiobolus azoricus]